MLPTESERWFIEYFHQSFIDLERYCRTKADYNLKLRIMLAEKDRSKIPEWMEIIDYFMEYDSVEQREHKMYIYRRWVSYGYGAYLFKESPDEHIIDINT